jgi:ketosteroid isomerase-like protein
MPPHASPRQTLERYLDLVAEQRFDRLADLYAADAVVEHPLERGRLEGRAAIRAHFEQLAALGLSMRAEGVRMHETTDPEVVVAEFDYRGRAGAAGHPVLRRNVFVWRVRDGRIQHARDYATPL